MEAHPRAQLTLHVNAHVHALDAEPRETLLDVLRDRLGLTGTKAACDMGQCGACTVLVDGKAVYACLTLAVDCAEKAVTTIEGIAGDGALHPVQRAFAETDALQCGFCTPGQILSLVALLDATPRPSEAQIERAVSGNLCRCGAYRNILEAARRAVHARG